MPTKARSPLFLNFRWVIAVLVGGWSTGVGATTVDFNGLPGTCGITLASCSPFTSFTESGFTVTPLSGSWLAEVDFGNPAPSIVFLKTTAFDMTTTARIAVTDAGTPFSFSSIDLYSSVTPIPYTFTGLLNGNTVFTIDGTVPNTFGAFATVSNPDVTDTIDTLQITLSNPATPFCPTCAGNPVGLDNISLFNSSTAVPEPATLTLLGIGLTALGIIRRRRTAQTT